MTRIKQILKEWSLGFEKDSRSKGHIKILLKWKKKCTPRHMLIKVLNSKDKEKNEFFTLFPAKIMWKNRWGQPSMDVHEHRQERNVLPFQTNSGLMAIKWNINSIRKTILISGVSSYFIINFVHWWDYVHLFHIYKPRITLLAKIFCGNTWAIHATHSDLGPSKCWKYLKI